MWLTEHFWPEVRGERQQVFSMATDGDLLPRSIVPHHQLLLEIDGQTQVLQNRSAHQHWSFARDQKSGDVPVGVIEEHGDSCLPATCYTVISSKMENSLDSGELDAVGVVLETFEVFNISMKRACTHEVC